MLNLMMACAHAAVMAIDARVALQALELGDFKTDLAEGC